MFEFLSTDVLTTLFEIVLINLMLSGDNAIVIGLAAAGLQRPLERWLLYCCGTHILCRPDPTVYNRAVSSFKLAGADE